jgi:uncharacterized Zn ribbon protein
MKNQTWCDMHGTLLKVGDPVVFVDNTELKGDLPKLGQIIMVTKLVDQESNYMEFGKNGFFGHRVLKLVTN